MAPLSLRAIFSIEHWRSRRMRGSKDARSRRTILPNHGRALRWKARTQSRGRRALVAFDDQGEFKADFTEFLRIAPPPIGCAPSDSLRGHFVMRFLDSLRAGAGKVRPVKMSGCDSTVFDPCHGVAIAAAVLRGPADSRGSCVLRIENRPGASVIVRKISFHRDRAPRQPKCHPPCGLIDRFGTNRGDFIATGARRLSHFLLGRPDALVTVKRTFFAV
jgi:hypothetical protein